MSSRLSRGVLLVVACTIWLLGSSSCDEPEHPCDAFARFADAMEERCGVLTWDCWEHYPTLGPEAQQDLDWCLDCVLLAESGDGDGPCDAPAPLSGVLCGELLFETLDATCFAP